MALHSVVAILHAAILSIGYKNLMLCRSSDGLPKLWVALKFVLVITRQDQAGKTNVLNFCCSLLLQSLQAQDLHHLCCTSEPFKCFSPGKYRVVALKSRP